MIYECDQCSKALPPGVTACPNCEEQFDESVPADAEVPKPGFSPATPYPSTLTSTLPPTPALLPVDVPLPTHQETPFQEASSPKPQEYIRSATIGSEVKNQWRKPITGPQWWFFIFVIVVLGGIIGNSHSDSSASTGIASGSAPTLAVPAITTTISKPISAPLTPAQKKAAIQQARENQRAERREARREKREKAQQEQEQARLQAETEHQQAATERADADDQAVYSRIKASLAKDYPDSYITQKDLYDANVSAYQYMKTVSDGDVKASLERDYPDSYITQKDLYDANIQAKRDLGQ